MKDKELSEQNGTKIKYKGTTTRPRTDNEYTEVMDCFCLLRLTINSKVINCQKICCRLAIGIITINALERQKQERMYCMPRNNCVDNGFLCDTMKSQTLKKQDRKRIDIFEFRC